jgi:hypothetical protein
MNELFQDDVALMGPTKYFYVDCTVGDALRSQTQKRMLHLLLHRSLVGNAAAPPLHLFLLSRKPLEISS